MEDFYKWKVKMKLGCFIKRFKGVINVVSVVWKSRDYLLWIEGYLKVFIEWVLVGKMYILVSYVVLNVEFVFSEGVG